MLTGMKNNKKPISWPWALLLLVSGCSDSNNVADELRNIDAERASDTAGEAAPGTGIVFPVRIGEDGPRFSACGSAGRVRGLGANGELEVQAAPFDDAEAIDSLRNEQGLFICMRSLDQKWFGVVYPNEGQDAAECGVSSPIRTRRDYDGPCRSGWVASAFIQLVAR